MLLIVMSGFIVYKLELIPKSGSQNITVSIGDMNVTDFVTWGNLTLLDFTNTSYIESLLEQYSLIDHIHTYDFSDFANDSQTIVLNFTNFVGYNGKIFDLTYADTSHHYTSSVATALSETRTVVGLVLTSTRSSGTGNLNVYSIEGASYDLVSTIRTGCSVIGIINDRIEHNLSVANDDFDLYCLGYWVSYSVTVVIP